MDALTTIAPARSGSRPATHDLAAVAALVFVSVCAGLWLSDQLGRISAIWAANAILVFYLLKRERRDWPLVLAAGLGANYAGDLFMGEGIFAAFWLTFCNGVGILIIAAPLDFWGLKANFARPKSLCVFYALAAGPASAFSGLLAAFYFHFWIGRDYFTSALDWYATDALCYSIIVPVLMTVRVDALKKMFGKDEILETLGLFGIVAAAVLLNLAARDWPLAFLFYPAILLVTFRRGFAGGSIALLIAGAYMMVPVLIRDPSAALRGHSLRDQIIIIQIFISVMGFLVLLVGAALAERRRLEEGLASAIVRAESAREEALVARDSAEQANRMKSMFLATMSHELRTPLNAIIGFSELMHTQLHGPHADSRYQEYSGLIKSAGHHLLSLINDVLDMSKIEAGKFELHRERFDLRETVHECLNLMRERARQGGVALAEELPASPLAIDADARAIKQILLNLLSNAIKFTPDGGKVTVHAHFEPERLVLKVRDTGIGIPSDQLSRLGNPFVQIRSNAGAAHEGTGLGLALVRALAETHDGAFRIESTLGHGTTVSVTIPLYAASEIRSPARLARAG